MNSKELQDAELKQAATYVEKLSEYSRLYTLRMSVTAWLNAINLQTHKNTGNISVLKREEHTPEMIAQLTLFLRLIEHIEIDSSKPDVYAIKLFLTAYHINLSTITDSVEEPIFISKTLHLLFEQNLERLSALSKPYLP